MSEIEPRGLPATPQPEPPPGGAPVSDQPSEQPSARGAGKRRRVIRPIRLLLGLSLSFGLALILMVASVLGTQSGLRLAVALAEDFAPGVLSIERIEGRVLGALQLGQLKLRLGELSMDAGSVQLDWTPFAAVGGTLPIPTLRVSDLDLVLPPPSDEPKPPLVLPDIVLPLAVDLGEARVERVRLYNAGDTAPFLQIDHAALSANLTGSELTLRRFEATLPSPALTARASGQVELTAAYPLTLNLDWEVTEAPAVALQGSAQIRGDTTALAVRHRLSGSARADLRLRVADLLQEPSWDGMLEIIALDLPDFVADAPAVEVSGRLETQGDLVKAAVTGQLDARAPDLPDFGHLAAVLDVTWSERVLAIRRLDLNEQVSDALFTATGRLDLSADPGRFEIEGNWERLRWPLSGDLVAESERGELDASGRFDAFDYALSLVAQGPAIPQTTLDLTGTGSQTGVRIAPLKLVQGEGELRGEGRFDWSPALSWTLALNGKDLNPGAFVEGLEDRLALQINTSGGLDAFDYTLDAQSVGPGLPASRLHLDGTGDQRQVRVETLDLNTLGGRMTGNARVGWDPRLTWEATLDASDIDPGVYAVGWGGNLAGRLTSRGTIEPSGPDLVARIEGVEGILRGFVVVASGAVTMVGETIRIENLGAASGPTSVRVQGQIDQQLDLTFDVESSDLTSLMPETRGALSAHGRVSGPREAPRLLLDLSARNAEWQGQGIATLTGALDVGIAREDPFEIRLDGTGLVLGNLTWSALSVRGTGRIPDHRFDLSLQGQPMSVTFASSGRLDAAGAYAGEIARLDLATTSFGDWSLQRPTPVSLDGSRITAGPLCLRGPGGTGGCAEVSRDAANRANASLDVDVADFTLLAPLLPPNLALTGQGRIKGRFELADAVLSGKATAEIPQGLLRAPIGRGQEQVLDFSGTLLGIDAGARSLSARLALPLQGHGQVDGTLDLAGWRLDAPARPGQPLSGSLRADIQGLDRLSDLVPDITGLTGGVSVDLALSGTLDQPGVRGEARVQDVGFTVPLVGLKVADLNLTASAAAIDRFDLRGQADVGGGRLEIIGDGGLGAGGFVGQAKIFGTGLTVADTREYFALVSPNIDIQVSATGARLTGEIQIPEARIRPRSIPAGVKTPSRDVVLIGYETTTPFPLEIDLRLVLGEQVTVDAFGVRGRLAGNLAMRQQPGRVMLGDGQLQIIDGQYRLNVGFGLAAELGAPLNIVQGRMIFARSPIDNPGLVIQAQRDGGATVAGVQVLGTLRDPKLAFFSETNPNMTQAEVMKFLVTGIAPSAGNDSVNPGLAVGTYIAPKLFLEYDTGLGAQSNSVRLRYDLTNRIEVQTETGGNQGADIFFTFER